MMLAPELVQQKEKEDTNSTEQSGPLCTLFLTSRQASFISRLLPPRYSFQCLKSLKSKSKMKASKGSKSKRGVSESRSMGVSSKKENDQASMPPIDAKSNSDRCSQKAEGTLEKEVTPLPQSTPQVQGKVDLLETTICKFVQAVLKDWENDLAFGEQLEKVKTRTKEGCYKDFSEFENEIKEILKTRCLGKKGRAKSVKSIQELFRDYSQIYQQIQSNPKSSSQFQSDKNKSCFTQIGSKTRSKVLKKGLKEIIGKESSSCRVRNQKNRKVEPVEDNLFAVTEVSESETKQQGPISCQKVGYINKLLSKLHRFDQETLLKTLSSQNNGCLIKDLRLRDAKIFVAKIKELLLKNGIEEKGEPVLESSFQVQSEYSN